MSPANHDRDSYDAAAAAELKRKRTFRKFSYRGVDLDDLLDMSNEDFVKLVHARARRRFSRGLKRKPMALIKKLRKAKKEAQPNEKPAVVRTHMRDMIVVPEMIGSMIGVYNGKVRTYALFTLLTPGVHDCRNQARDDRPLPRRVCH